jgi:hypothetical protein
VEPLGGCPSGAAAALKRGNIRYYIRRIINELRNLYEVN